MTADRGALAELVRPVRGRLALGVVLAGISAVCGLLPFVAIAEIGRLLLAAAVVDRDAIWTWAAIGTAGGAGRFVLYAAAGLLNHHADADLQLGVRLRMADRLARVPLGWFGARGSGAVKKALGDDVAAMHHLVAHAAGDLACAVTLPVAAVLYLAAVDWRMTLVTLAVIPIALVAMSLAMRGFGDRLAGYEAAQRRVANAVVAYADGLPVVKVFGTGERAFEEYSRAVDEYGAVHGAWMASSRRAGAATHLVLSPVTVLLLVLAVGGVLVRAGQLAPPDLLPFLLVGVAVPAPYLAIGYGVFALRVAREAAASVLALLRTEVLARPAVAETGRGHGVRFDAVTFRYAQDGPDVLREVSFELAPDTVTALVGPSGSGKSTIGRLVPRFFDVSAGAVLVGGVDVRRWDPDQLLRQVGVVFQDVRVVRASVRDNIRLGRPSATDGEVVAAATAARIHHVVSALPDGYHTVLGGTAGLSGGELQRITIARAILQDAPIVVLDEATAFADPHSEAAVQDALAALAAGRTVLVIAHRLHTIVGVDQIVVLDGGRVVQRGTHEELLADGDGRYAALWDARVPVAVPVGSS